MLLKFSSMKLYTKSRDHYENSKKAQDFSSSQELRQDGIDQDKTAITATPISKSNWLIKCCKGLTVRVLV